MLVPINRQARRASVAPLAAAVPASPWLPLGRLAIIATFEVVLLQYGLDINTSLIVVTVVCVLAAITNISSATGAQFISKVAAGVAAATGGGGADASAAEGKEGTA